MKRRIIGCGNRDRQDDAAGVLVAERLREMGIAAEIQTGGAFELISTWDHAECVILIDAVVTGSPCGTVHCWEGCPPSVPELQPFSSHGFGLAEAFRLGQVLNCLPKHLTVYGIEGKQFGFGETVSPGVIAAVEKVAHQIAGVPFTAETAEHAEKTESNP